MASTGAKLSTIRRQLIREHQQVHVCARKSLQHAVRAGALLTQAKKRLAHGR